MNLSARERQTIANLLRDEARELRLSISNYNARLNLADRHLTQARRADELSELADRVEWGD